MSATDRLEELHTRGDVEWLHTAPGWSGEPDEIIGLFVADGYEEYKREIIREAAGRTPSGGLWQGLNPETGATASVIWVTGGEAAPRRVFVHLAETLRASGPDRRPTAMLRL